METKEQPDSQYCQPDKQGWRRVFNPVFNMIAKWAEQRSEKDMRSAELMLGRIRNDRIQGILPFVGVDIDTSVANVYLGFIGLAALDTHITVRFYDGQGDDPCMTAQVLPLEFSADEARTVLVLFVNLNSRLSRSFRAGRMYYEESDKAAIEHAFTTFGKLVYLEDKNKTNTLL